MQPNFTITWHLDEVKHISTEFVKYSAASGFMGVIRHFYVRNEWTVEGEEHEADLEVVDE